MDEPPVRAWTLEEANSALSWVNDLVEQAQKLWTDFREQSVTGLRLVRQNGHGVVPADPRPIQRCIDELSAEGVVLRDIERGLVDFPARTSNGRWYWLCWLHGEERVDWWHWLDAGFAGRSPIDDLPE